jgi:hypothetical protein
MDLGAAARGACDFQAHFFAELTADLNRQEQSETLAPEYVINSAAQT